MNRIIALNDELKDEVEEEEIIATKEAQETIAESEYVRAMKLKSDRKIDLCLELLKELLETQVLNENIKSNNNEKLLVIKYNCHKNIAIILEERCEYTLALQHYISAILIDNTDVFTLHKFGQLALKLNVIDLAEYAFESCLARNSAHWSAAEGMLQVMSRNHNVIGAYSWATKLCRLDPHSQKAKQTLQEITTLFSENLSFFEKCSGLITEDLQTQKTFDKPSFRHLFDKTAENFVESPDSTDDKIPDLKNFNIKSSSWYEIGQFIINAYSHLKLVGHNMLFTFDFNDILENSYSPDLADNLNQPQVTAPNHNNKYTKCVATAATSLIKLDNNEGEQNSNSKVFEIIADQSKPLGNEQGDAQSMDSNNYESDSNAKSDGFEANKSKPRRRCSDLHFLEQWGWHKSRRYASRKKNERDDIDTSLNGYLRKILVKYTGKNIDEKWPFNKMSKSENKKDFDLQCKNCKIISSDESFQMATQCEFDKFTNKLKAKRIDLMVLIYKWLKHISVFWNLAMPDKLKMLYVEIFNLYVLHFDLTTWNQLTPNNFETSCRICLFYLELSIKREINYNFDLWLQVFNHLLFNIGNSHITAVGDMDIYKLRLIYLEYLLFNEKLQYNDCLLCLQRMLDIFSKQEPSFILHLPNSNNVCIDTKFVENAQFQYERQIDDNNIPKLYENECWSQLADIIICSIESSTNNYYDDNWLNDFRIEVELLLQSFWKMSNYESCLLWSEKFFHYAVSHYLEESKSTYRQKLLAELINFTTSYIEAILLNEGFHIILHLNEECLSRMVQNIIRILVYQFEGTFDKNSSHGQELDFKRPWVILHQLILRDENDSSNTIIIKSDDSEDGSELIPNSFLILFTAHEYLGKRQWCTNDNGDFLQYVLDAVVFNLRAPIYDVCRDVIYEYIEQVTYCLYKYPQKRARSRHLEDHEASQIKLTWPKAMQIFDLYRPEDLPEFNSYKLESITSDMEQLLLKIISLMPKELDPSTSIHNVTLFVEGHSNLPPLEANAFKMPYKIISLFYLMADFYFKNRDFSKAIKFYTLDLAVNPTRFDSWAGMALSKASKIETKLNGLDPINLETLWEECEEVLRCFECCINLNRFQTLLWIEYGSFSYIIHSYFSRSLKQNTEKCSIEELSSIEERKRKMLTIAYNCFSCANSLQNSTSGYIEENSDANDEKWLCQYMLGKVSEKRKEEPNVYLNHYLMAANYLYENGATYPIKINHSNPTSLSVEALEVFYRTNAAIIKYLESAKEISRCTGNLFNKILKNLSNSPFAYNKAKIDGNSLNILKGKLIKKCKSPSSYTQNQSAQSIGSEINIPTGDSSNNEEQVRLYDETKEKESSFPLTTTLITSSATSSAVSSDSSTLESESDSEDCLTENEGNKPKNDAPFSKEEQQIIYRMVVQNIEECATRFPEHYKSIYRLIHHYMNSLPDWCDLKQSEQLLLGQYKTSLGNIINGLFYDRKNNNLFNGIWRIPSSEIDRPGSFSTHLVKCVDILIQLLYKTNNHKILMDIALNLYKSPDLDKRYIMDSERKQLYHKIINYCVEILRSILQKNIEKRDDINTLNLLIDIYKIHKKCVKYMNQKEPVFTELLIDVYKFFITDKVEHVPDNCNFLDLAIKLCVQEIAAQKTVEKSNITDNSTNTSDYIVAQSTSKPQFSNTQATGTFHIPGLTTRPKPRTIATKGFLSTSSHKSDIQTGCFSLSTPDLMKSLQFMPMMDLFGGGNTLTGSDTSEFQKLFEEYYSKILETSKNQEMQKQQALEYIPNSLGFVLPSTSNATSIQDMSKSCNLNYVDESLSTSTSNTTKQYTKAKSSIKTKTAYKPYNRPVEGDNVNKIAQGSFFNINTFSNHANMLAAYSNLLQNTTTTIPQVDYTNNVFGSAERKTSSAHSGTSNTTSFTNVSKYVEHQSIENNASTSLQATTSYSSIELKHSSNFEPSRQSLSHQQCLSSGITISPTKTLQEKLAERQKACQQNETNTSSTVKLSDEISCADVIILD